MWQVDVFQFLCALGLDLLLGDPRSWPHVARMTGALAVVGEDFWTRALGRSVISGGLFWISVCGAMLLAYVLIHEILYSVSHLLASIWDIFIIYQTLAARDLDRHAREVLVPLLRGDLEEARFRVGFLVGRDTEALDVAGVSRAAVEAVAESATDGFVAPLFWAAVGGAPAALLYRCVNTLDSMVGHRNERYELFGKVSALADDALSFVPARLCGFASLLTRGFQYSGEVMGEAGKHASPNAGWSEAAAAWALNLRLGGVNFYDGVPIEGPIFNKEAPSPEPADILRVLRWFWGVALVCAFVLSLFVLTRQRDLRQPETYSAPALGDVSVAEPVLKQEFVAQPAPAPVKLHGMITYGTKSTP